MTLYTPAAPIDFGPLVSDGPKNVYRDLNRALNVSRAPTGRWTELEAALYNACMDAALPDWDGYGANAVSAQSAGLAHDLLAVLPTAFPAPSIGVDADGEISFEWQGAPGSLFGISVSPTGWLTYAGVYSGARQSGREPPSLQFPPSLLGQLQRLFDNGGDWRAA
jgi:hypothetical protein